MKNIASTIEQCASLAARCLHCSPSEITDMQTLKLGMTNHSYRFCFRGENYILRVPGEGTGKLIDRHQEAAVYAVLKGLGICDDVVAIDPDEGWKISRFYEPARVCDPCNEEDLKLCMQKLREFHGKALSVGHEFDLFGQIDFYESLREGKASQYADYGAVKKSVLRLKEPIDRAAPRKTLAHIDAVCDNFLFVGDGDIRLIDWEYAGMQDPYVDIAMFCIYAMYDRAQTDHLIDLYFENNCPARDRARIYAYLAVCGLLWSNWCEYKKHLGVDFGEYAVRQYGFAREYAPMAFDALRATEEAR